MSRIEPPRSARPRARSRPRVTARREILRPRRAADSAPRPGSSCPSTRTIGASPKCRAKRSGSIVADVMMIFRSGRCRSMLSQVAQDEVDVEAALVRLVDDQRVVRREPAVAANLVQQDAVGHDLDQRARARLIREPHLETDGLAEPHLELARRAARPPLAPRSAAAACDRSCRARRSPASRQSFGSCVVLPLPVSPQTTITRCVASAARISSRAALIGNVLGIVAACTASRAARASRRSAEALTARPRARARLESRRRRAPSGRRAACRGTARPSRARPQDRCPAPAPIRRRACRAGTAPAANSALMPRAVVADA